MGKEEEALQGLYSYNPKMKKVFQVSNVVANLTGNRFIMPLTQNYELPGLSKVSSVALYCGTLLWCFIVGLYCRTLLSDLIVGPYCRTLLSDFIVGPYCGTLLWDLIVGPYCGTLLWDLIVGLIADII